MQYPQSWKKPLEEKPIGLLEQKLTATTMRLNPLQKESVMQIVLDPEKSQTVNLRKIKKNQ